MAENIEEQRQQARERAQQLLEQRRQARDRARSKVEQQQSLFAEDELSRSGAAFRGIEQGVRSVSETSCAASTKGARRR